MTRIFERNRQIGKMFENATLINFLGLKKMWTTFPRSKLPIFSQGLFPETAFLTIDLNQPMFVMLPCISKSTHGFLEPPVFRLIYGGGLSQ